MKKYLNLIMVAVVVLIATSCSPYTIYPVRKYPNRPVRGGVLYALPRTQIRVAVTFDRYDYAAAPYASFAKDMLGVEPLSESQAYAIRSIEVSAVNEADPDEYYYVVPRHTRLQVDERRLLMSVGSFTQDVQHKAPADASMSGLNASVQNEVRPEYNLYDRADTFYTRHDQPGRPSMVTTSKDVRSLKQRAQSAAEHIEDIREKKEALLFGEYEVNLSSDAIQYIYEQLDKMELQYMAEFLGSCQTETVVFYVDPRDEKTLIDDQTVELFRFNPVKGLVDSTDADAQVVSCNIRCENTLRNASRFVRYRTKSSSADNYFDRHSLKYRIPETAVVTIYSPQFSFSKQVKIAQFGCTATLPMGRCNALFNPITSELQQYQP